MKKVKSRLLLVVWVLILLVLAASGIGYRAAEKVINPEGGRQVELPVPLGEVPAVIRGWEGEDMAISQAILDVADNDDHLSRLYRHQTTNQWANIYIAYTARPRTMLGHRPQSCYPGAGWILDGTEEITITTAAGNELPALLHRFHTPMPDYREIVVLNYYIVNGTVTTDESVFSGLSWRTPNLAGDPARYVAQVQVMSVLEGSVRAAARDLTDEFLPFFPAAWDQSDENNEQGEAL